MGERIRNKYQRLYVQKYIWRYREAHAGAAGGTINAVVALGASRRRTLERRSNGSNDGDVHYTGNSRLGVWHGSIPRGVGSEHYFRHDGDFEPRPCLLFYALRIFLVSGADDNRKLLGGPSAPVNLGSWDELSPWVPHRGSSAAIKLPLNMGGRFEKKSYDWSKAKPVHEKWVRLSAKEKRHLRVPLQRLNTAMRREHEVDSAIDLGIALEAVFLSDREPDRGELGFTLRIRAARLLKADRDSRQELSRFMRMLYEMRSSAVHTGEISEVIGGMRVHRILEKGYLLTAQAIEHIIMNGGPDWQAIVFS